mmetsp:Transcript_57229/g.134223  ORF Transcript_57229/g.134223 Transcript_57229/m.134223 type:complete len:220 (+) Transcript_57229:1513-2172(+)
MAKKAPNVRWYSSLLERPELMAAPPSTSSKYRFSSGNATHKSSMKSRRVYSNLQIFFAMLLTLPQSVRVPSSELYKASHGGCLAFEFLDNIALVFILSTACWTGSKIGTEFPSTLCGMLTCTLVAMAAPARPPRLGSSTACVGMTAEPWASSLSFELQQQANMPPLGCCFAAGARAGEAVCFFANIRIKTSSTLTMLALNWVQFFFKKFRSASSGGYFS